MAKQTDLHKRQLNRVKDLMKSIEGRGFDISQFKHQIISDSRQRGYNGDDIVKALYSLSTQKLKTYTPETIYGKSEWINEDTGEVFFGLKAKTAYNKHKKELSKHSNTQEYSNIEGFEDQFIQERMKQDKKDMAMAANIAEGELIYSQFESLINAQPGKGAEYLRNLLKSEIKQFGQNNVMMALAELPEDIILNAQEVAYYENSANEHNKSLRNLAEAIKGTILSFRDRQELGDIFDETDTMV